MGNIIKNREFVVKNKYGHTRTSDVKEFIKDKYKSVVNVEFCETTSSAGNWSGLIIQELRGKCYAIPFSIENRYPDDGFNVYTGDYFRVIDSTKKYNEDYLYDIWIKCYLIMA